MRTEISYEGTTKDIIERVVREHMPAKCTVKFIEEETKGVIYKVHCKRKGYII